MLSCLVGLTCQHCPLTTALHRWAALCDSSFGATSGLELIMARNSVTCQINLWRSIRFPLSHLEASPNGYQQEEDENYI